MKKGGISLVALVITIIVLIILTAAVILTATNSNIFGKSEEAVFKSDVSTFNEELTKSILEEQLKDSNFDASTITTTGANADSITKWIPSIAGTKYENKFEIANGKLVYTGEDTKEKEYVQAIGITVSTSAESDSNSVSSASSSEVIHPNIQEGAIWTNVSLAQTLLLPEGELNDWQINLDNEGNNFIRFEKKYIEVDESKYDGVLVSFNGNRYLYSWGDYEPFNDVQDGYIDIDEGWNDDPYCSNGVSLPNINGIRLSGTVSLEGNVPQECINWFIQN